MMLPSLDLRWIARQDVTIPIPPIHFSDTSDLTYYARPRKQQSVWVLDGKEFDPRRGLIVINASFWTETRELGNVIAHEWRHCWQTYHGWDFTTYRPWQSTHPTLSYEDRVRVYYRQPAEYDALQFSQRHAPSPLAEWDWDLTHR